MQGGMGGGGREGQTVVVKLIIGIILHVHIDCVLERERMNE